MVYVVNTQATQIVCGHKVFRGFSVTPTAGFEKGSKFDRMVQSRKLLILDSRAEATSLAIILQKALQMGLQPENVVGWYTMGKMPLSVALKFQAWYHANKKTLGGPDVPEVPETPEKVTPPTDPALPPAAPVIPPTPPTDPTPPEAPEAPQANESTAPEAPVAPEAEKAPVAENPDSSSAPAPEVPPVIPPLTSPALGQRKHQAEHGPKTGRKP